MITQLYRDTLSEENIFAVYDTMKDIEKYTGKKFTTSEMNEIIKCFWDEGMVDFADFLTDNQIDKLLEVG